MYDERYGDIHFEEEDPHSEFYNPKCCRNVYLDLVNGIFEKKLTIDDDVYDSQDDIDDTHDDDNYYINGDDMSNYEDISNNQKEEVEVAEEVVEEEDENYYEADNEFDDY
jgi:hypothetical protein